MGRRPFGEVSICVEAIATERLGFIGREEGIACQAVASVLVRGDPGA